MPYYYHSLKHYIFFFKSIFKNNKRYRQYLSNLCNLENKTPKDALWSYIHQKIHISFFINVLSSGTNALRVALLKRCSYSELFWSVFAAFGLNTEICSANPYSVRMWENTGQENSEYGHFLRRVAYIRRRILSLKRILDPLMCNVPNHQIYFKNLRTLAAKRLNGSDHFETFFIKELISVTIGYLRI